MAHLFAPAHIKATASPSVQALIDGGEVILAGAIPQILTALAQYIGGVQIFNLSAFLIFSGFTVFIALLKAGAIFATAKGSPTSVAIGTSMLAVEAAIQQKVQAVTQPPTPVAASPPPSVSAWQPLPSITTVVQPQPVYQGPPPELAALLAPAPFTEVPARPALTPLPTTVPPFVPPARPVTPYPPAIQPYASVVTNQSAMPTQQWQLDPGLHFGDSSVVPTVQPWQVAGSDPGKSA